MNIPKKLTFWKTVFVLVLLSGVVSTWLRITRGLGGSTNLSDANPWGLWIGFDILCGVMLAAGGFTLMAAVHIFNVAKYKPVARPALLTAFLGYILVICALMFDLGKPWNVVRVMFTWQPRSVMFEVGWCVMLYTTVLFLEFLPIVFERFRLEKPMRWLRRISLPLFIAGIVLSTLHQSSLGSLYLIVPGKLHPLWYTPILPILFWMSAIAVGLAMTIFESATSARHIPGHALEPAIITGLGRILLVVLLVYGLVRTQNLLGRHALQYALQPTYEAAMFWVEVFLAFLLPIALLLMPRVRENPVRLYFVSILVICGFVMNRLNVAATGMERFAGERYLPRLTEVSITLSIVAVGIFIFSLAVRYLPIFSHGPAPAAQPADRTATSTSPALPAPAR